MLWVASVPWAADEHGSLHFQKTVNTVNILDWFRPILVNVSLNKGWLHTLLFLSCTHQLVSCQHYHIWDHAIGKIRDLGFETPLTEKQLWDYLFSQLGSGFTRTICQLIFAELTWAARGRLEDRQQKDKPRSINLCMPPSLCSSKAFIDGYWPPYGSAGTIRWKPCPKEFVSSQTEEKLHNSIQA